MPAAAAICSVFSTFFLAVSLNSRAPLQCPADHSPTMISVQHNTADGSLSLRSSTPRPVLRDGELLVKVYILLAVYLGLPGTRLCMLCCLCR